MEISQNSDNFVILYMYRLTSWYEICRLSLVVVVVVIYLVKKTQYRGKKSTTVQEYKSTRV